MGTRSLPLASEEPKGGWAIRLGGCNGGLDSGILSFLVFRFLEKTKTSPSLRMDVRQLPILTLAEFPVEGSALDMVASQNREPSSPGKARNV